MSTHKHAHFLLTRIRRNEIFESGTGYIDIRTRKVCRNRSEHPHPVCGRCAWWIYSTNSAEDYLDSQDTFSWRRDRERREWLTAAAPVEPRAARRGGRVGGGRLTSCVPHGQRRQQHISCIQSIKSESESDASDHWQVIHIAPTDQRPTDRRTGVPAVYAH